MKFIFIIILCFLGYKLVVGNRGLDAAKKQEKINKKENEEFSDYEELD